MDHSPRFLRIVNETKARIRELSVAQVREKLDKGESFALIDVREDREWDEGHVKDAAHIGRGVLERDIERAFPDVETEIVLYCGGGFRSALAADMLQRMGYTRVYSMDGGWRAWNDAGGPTEGAKR